MTRQELSCSDMQAEVRRVLTDLGLRPREEVVTDEGYRLDFVVDIDGERVGLEVDGPQHFVTTTMEPNAVTHLKHRQLRRLSHWRIVVVPYFRWRDCEGSVGRQRRLLTRLLTQRGPIRLVQQ